MLRSLTDLYFYYFYLDISAQCVASSVTTFKIPFIIMTVLFCVLLFVIVCYIILKWRRQSTTGNTKDKTERATTDEIIPMNDTKDNNNELATA